MSCYFFVIFYGNQFSTDLTVSMPLKPINTFEQLLESDKSPAFDVPTGLYQVFFERAPFGSIYQKIWTRTSKTHIYEGDELVNINQYMRKDEANIAFIGPDLPLNLVRHVSCVSDPFRLDINYIYQLKSNMNVFASASDFYMSSDNLLTWLLIGAISKKASIEVRSRMELIYQRGFEVGLNDYLFKFSGIKMGHWIHGKKNYGTCIDLGIDSYTPLMVRSQITMA